MKSKQQGFSLVELLIILFFVCVIGFVGYKVAAGGDDKKDTRVEVSASKSKTSNESVVWAFNQDNNSYFAKSGTPPKCKEPFKFDMSPVDISAATVVGYPGAYRGYSYKPHGGFRFDNSQDGQMEIKLPYDATLTGLKRYYEGSPQSLQYLLTFESDCGIAIRFDHLHTLSPKFQEIAETTPEPTTSTQGNPDDNPKRQSFKAGEVVATAIGFPANHNFGFDFGVYDYRQRNEVSKNAEWSALHNNYTSLEWYGVCWFDMLPGGDAAKATALSEINVNPAKPNQVSDYCPNADHTTLDFNDGKPTDG